MVEYTRCIGGENALFKPSPGFLPSKLNDLDTDHCDCQATIRFVDNLKKDPEFKTNL